MANLRIGIIGLGIGSWHLHEYTNTPGAEVIALADLDKDKLRSKTDEYDISRHYTDYESLIADKDIDAVSICLPNYLHEPAALAALEAGKHVLLEKPLAHTLASGRKIADAAEASDRTVMIGMKLRYAPAPRLVRSLVDAGRLGKVYYGLNRYTRAFGSLPRGWFYKRDLSGGGTVIDNGVHLIDLNWYLMGCPEPIEVMAGTHHELAGELTDGDADVEDFAAICIRFANGAMMLVESAWAAHVPEEIFEVRVLGTAGGARTHPELEVTLAGKESAETASEVESQFAHFINCIQTNKTPETDVTAGLTVLKILDAAYRSAETGKAVSLI